MVADDLVEVLGSDPRRATATPGTAKHTILFVAANPLVTDRRALDEQARAIQMELERSGQRDHFDLVTRWAVQPLDLLRELRKLKPTVVHFSGHGGCGKPGLVDAEHLGVGDEPSIGDAGDQHGLFFQGLDGRAQLVSTLGLEETFGAAGSSVRLVVLDACYSEGQARALLAHVDCIVAIGGSIRDEAAHAFAVGFYGGIGERESIAAAYKQGCAAISLEGLPDSERPRLYVRDGVDAGRVVLAEIHLEHMAPANPQHQMDLIVRVAKVSLMVLAALLAPLKKIHDPVPGREPGRHRPARARQLG